MSDALALNQSNTLILPQAADSKLRQFKLPFKLNSKVGMFIAVTLLGLFLKSHLDSQTIKNPVINHPTLDPVAETINEQVLQTVVAESVVPQRQAEYIDTYDLARTAFSEGRYCDYSILTFTQAEIILSDPDQTVEDLWRVYGMLQQAAGVNPFDERIQKPIIDTMNKLGLNSTPQQIYLRDAERIFSSCEG